MQFTHEHQELKRNVQRFIDKEINPFVDEWEEADRQRRKARGATTREEADGQRWKAGGAMVDEAAARRRTTAAPSTRQPRAHTAAA